MNVKMCVRESVCNDLPPDGRDERECWAYIVKHMIRTTQCSCLQPGSQLAGVIIWSWLQMKIGLELCTSPQWHTLGSGSGRGADLFRHYAGWPPWRDTHLISGNGGRLHRCYKNILGMAVEWWALSVWDPLLCVLQTRYMSPLEGTASPLVFHFSCFLYARKKQTVH